MKLLLTILFLYSLSLFSQKYEDVYINELHINNNIETSTFDYILKSPLLPVSVTFTLPPTVGTNGQYLSFNNDGSLTWTTLSGGSATPGGSNTNIQFNNSGVFGGSNNFVWDNTNTRVGIGTAAPAYTLDVNGDVMSGIDGTDGSIRVYSEQGATDYELIFTPPTTMTQSTTYTFPSTNGPVDDLLVNDGNGNLYWASDAVGGTFPCNGQGTGGGSGNTADGTDSFIGGGSGNEVASGATGAVVGGGTNNSIDGDRTAILGGANNYTGSSADNSTIGAGTNNTVMGDNSIIGAGSNNATSTAADQAFFGAGYGNYIASDNCAIASGESNTISTGANQNMIGTGFSNYLASADNAGIWTGYDNTINNAAADRSAIVAGRKNNISDNDCFIGAGSFNGITTTGAQYSAIVGGYSNGMTGEYSTILGGYSNTITGNYAFSSGRGCESNADYTFTVGRRARATSSGSWAFADATDADLTSSTSNRLEMRFSGGFRFYTNAAQTTGAFMNSGASSWSYYSDINRKTNLLKLNNSNIFSNLMKLKIASYNYKEQDDLTLRSYGPMAQDFYALFGKDEFGYFSSEKEIFPYHLAGLGISSLQFIDKELKKSNEELEKLLKENNELDLEIEYLENLISEYEKELK